MKAPRAPRHPPSWGAGQAEWGRKQRSCSAFSSTSLSGPSASAFHWQPGDPGRGGHARDLVEKLYRRDTATDDDHVLTSELLGRSVIFGVKLPALEPFRAWVLRDVCSLPCARGVDHPAGREAVPVRLDPQTFAPNANNRHFYGPIDGKIEGPFVDGEVARHRDARLHLRNLGVHRLGEAHPGQIVNSVDGAELQRRPAELPGASRLGRLIQHDESPP